MPTGPAPFYGILYRDWRRIRRAVGPLSPGQGKRLAHILVRSLLNEAMHWQDERQFGRQIDEQEVSPPLIVLGLARSGTTFLHQLLARDPRFAYPTASQACNPHTFLTREGFTRGPASFFLRGCNLLLSYLTYRKTATPRTRGVDNVLVGWALPSEDEVAMLQSGLGANPGIFFSRNPSFFLGDEAERRFEKCWLRFLRKLSFVSQGRPLVLKSPAHTARLPLILRVFPRSRFVFISRHPEDIYRSIFRLGDSLASQTFQPLYRPGELFLQSQRLFYEKYLRDRSLIPEGQIYELRYEDLTAHPERELEKAYEALSLPNFEPMRDPLRQALAERANYQTVPRYELASAVSERLRREWGPYYQAFGYE